MAIVYVEIICANPDCRADLAYGDAYKDNKETEVECKYCGCKEHYRYYSYDG